MHLVIKSDMTGGITFEHNVIAMDRGIDGALSIDKYIDNEIIH